MLRRFILLASILALHVAGPAGAAQASGSAGSLRAAYGHMQAGLRSNPFGRPIQLDSRESASELKGEMHAVIDHSYGLVSSALSDPGNWCDILILHLNTKHCQAGEGDGSSFLVVNIGKKHDQPLDKTHPVRFGFRLKAATPEYFAVELNADSGPYSTKNYSILLEAIPLQQGRTFLHLSYSYGFGMAARLALQAYLGTMGSAKVGFTQIGTRPDGAPVYVGGVRGMIERNTMRYHLAIESYLESLSVPAEERVEKRLNDWFAAAESYPRQLHEMERDAYLAMKRREIRRLES